MAVVQGSTVAYGRYADTHVAKKTEAILVQGDGGWIAGIRETIVAAVPLGNGTVHLMARTRETVQGETVHVSPATRGKLSGRHTTAAANQEDDIGCCSLVCILTCLFGPLLLFLVASVGLSIAILIFKNDIDLSTPNIDAYICAPIAGLCVAVAGMMIASVFLFCCCGCCWVVEKMRNRSSIWVYMLRITLFSVMLAVLLILIVIAGTFYGVCDQRSYFTTIFILMCSIPAMGLMTLAYYGCFAYLVNLCKK
eukprot:Em0001g1245a